MAKTILALGAALVVALAVGAADASPKKPGWHSGHKAPGQSSWHQPSKKNPGHHPSRKHPVHHPSSKTPGLGR